MAIRNIGGVTTTETDALQQQQSTPAQPKPSIETQREAFQPVDTKANSARLQPKFEESRQEFQAQIIRQNITGPLSTPVNNEVSATGAGNATAAATTTSTGPITKDPNYQRLSSSSRAIISSALARNPNNKDLDTQVRTMIADSRFQRLPTNDRDLALTGLTKNPGARAADLIQFTGTSSYKSFSRAQRQQGQMIIGVLSADSTNNPSHNPMARNTVDLMVKGIVEVGLPTKRELFEGGFTEADLQGLYGFADGNTMYFNVHMPGLLENKEDLMRTAAHEINHVISGDTEYDTPERALDEYRAWYAENFAVGINPPSVEYMQGVWENFFSPNAGYENIREVYVKDAGFRKIVDQIKTDLDNGKVTDPEAFRKSLVTLIGKSPLIKDPQYLRTPGNLFNDPNMINRSSAAS